MDVSCSASTRPLNPWPAPASSARASAMAASPFTGRCIHPLRLRDNAGSRSTTYIPPDAPRQRTDARAVCAGDARGMSSRVPHADLSWPRRSLLRLGSSRGNEILTSIDAVVLLALIGVQL